MPALPTIGSLYVRPNGEAWRVSDHRSTLRNPGEVTVEFTVLRVDGWTSAGNGPALPKDAVLVWAPDATETRTETQHRVQWGEGDASGWTDDLAYCQRKASAKHGDRIETRTRAVTTVTTITEEA